MKYEPTENVDPSFSEELSSLPDWDRSFWLSRAYIEASRCLYKSMLSGDFTSQYSSSRVILNLARQGIELFLKAALGAVNSTPLTHDLDRLYFEYRLAFPALIFNFKMPARFGVEATRSLFPEDHNSFHATLDQRHRYPTDRAGNNFATRETFAPQETLQELEDLDKELKVLEWARIRPHLEGKSVIG
jgi:hypothetical protein